MVFFWSSQCYLPHTPWVPCKWNLVYEAQLNGTGWMITLKMAYLVHPYCKYNAGPTTKATSVTSYLEVKVSLKLKPTSFCITVLSTTGFAVTISTHIALDVELLVTPSFFFLSTRLMHTRGQRIFLYFNLLFPMSRWPLVNN